jgi:hypothetical protein
MLGPFNAVLDYFIAHPNTLTLLLTLWLCMYGLGRYQLKRIEAKSTAWLLTRSRALLIADPGLTPPDLYQQLYPLWTEEFKKWRYVYIPNKYDLWPVPASLKNVQAKMPFSVDWIAKVLAKQGVITSASGVPKN